MTLDSHNHAACPHCGAPLEAPKRALRAVPTVDRFRYDVEALSAEAAQEKAFDETTRVRVTQRDIRNLLEKRRKARK
jgi:hypothetical protein